MFLRWMFLLYIFVALSAKSDDKVIYEIHNHEDGRLLLSVEAKFIGANKSSTDVYIPVLSGIESISAKSNDIKLNVRRKSDILCLGHTPFFCKVFSIQHNPNALITLEYSAGKSFGFYKDNEHIIFEANKALIFPILNKDNVIEFQLYSDSLNMPQSKIVSSKYVQNLKEPLQIPINDFYSKVLLFSKKNIHSSNYKDLYITSAGFEYSNEKVKSVTHKSMRDLSYLIFSKNQIFIENILGVLRTTPLKSLITVKKSNDEGGFAGFNTDATNILLIKQSYGHKDISSIISHEYMHNLFAKSTYLSVDFGPNMTFNHLWFDEGFTDYYGDILNYRNGIVSKKEYLESLNHAIEQHYKFYRMLQYQIYDNPKDKSLILNSQKFFDNNYYAGRMIAIDIDNMIRAKSNREYKLDDLLRNAVSFACVKLPCNLKDKVFSKVLSDLIGDENQLFAKQYINQYIIKFHPISLPEFIYEPSAKLRYKRINDGFNYGFNFEESVKSGVISEVNEGSNAYKSGLRNGMRLLNYDYEIDEDKRSLGKLSIKVKNENSSDCIISFEPKGPMLLPYYK